MGAKKKRDTVKKDPARKPSDFGEKRGKFDRDVRDKKIIHDVVDTQPPPDKKPKR